MAPHNYPSSPFDRLEDAQRSFREINSTIRELRKTVIEAETSTDEERRKAIQKAITAACLLITDLWEGLDVLIDSKLEAVGLEPRTDAPVNFGTLIESSDELKTLKDRDTFRRLLQTATSVVQFQDAVEDIVAVQTLVDEVVHSFEQLKDQPLGTKDILLQIARVRSAVCRPPFDGGGGRTVDNPKGPPPSGPGVLESLRRYADDIARVLALLGAWALLNGAPIERPSVPPPAPPPIVILALLVFCFLADDLIDRGVVAADVPLLALTAGGRFVYVPPELVKA
jgi:hypothetical protein